jgi:hypothetical protein
MEEYIHTLPCGCEELRSINDEHGLMNVVHLTLSDFLSSPKLNTRMNALDEKRRKKILYYLEALKNWISTEVDFDEAKRYEIVKELHKIARALKQLAIDVNNFFY